MSFREKVVVITGAAGGIGKATAKLFAAEQAKLVLIDLDEQSLKNAVSELELNAGDYLTVSADVTKEDQVQNYVEKSLSQFGKIDVFFNNAGIEGKFALITDQEGANLDNVLAVNIKGVFYGLKHVLKVMTGQKSGAVVNTASVAGLRGSPGLSPYVASKHAVIGLTKTAALECAGTGVRVNAVCPAPVNTRMMRSIEEGAAPGQAEEAQKQYAEAVPVKRYAESDEIGQLVLFLASDKASYITGSYYTVDGGMTAS